VFSGCEPIKGVCPVVGRAEKYVLGTPAAMYLITVNWLIDSIRWTWLTISAVTFIAAEFLAVFYLYKFLGWM
jgi:hypothetical protein